MSTNGIPDGTPTGPPPHDDGGILGALEQLFEKYIARHSDRPVVVAEPDVRPVVESQLSTPPYAGMAHAEPGRYQQEVFGVRLNAAGPLTAAYNLRTRCDFITVTTFAVGAVAPDANDAVWVALSGTPPAIPVLTPGVVQNVPFRIDAGKNITIHGAEQTISFTLDSTIDLVVVFVCNTNVRSVY